MGDLGLIPGVERSPEEGKGYPVQYSGLENLFRLIVQQTYEWLLRAALLWVAGPVFSWGRRIVVHTECQTLMTTGEKNGDEEQGVGRGWWGLRLQTEGRGKLP